MKKQGEQMLSLFFACTAAGNGWFPVKLLSIIQIQVHPGDEKEILMNIVNSYLYKDVFEFQDIRKPAVREP